jgi:hypothetical protein
MNRGSFAHLLQTTACDPFWTGGVLPTTAHLYNTQSPLDPSSTAIGLRKYRIPSDLRSQAEYRLVSTTVGDHVGILGAVVFAIWKCWDGPGELLFLTASMDRGSLHGVTWQSSSWTGGVGRGLANLASLTIYRISWTGGVAWGLCISTVLPQSSHGPGEFLPNIGF